MNNYTPSVYDEQSKELKQFETNIQQELVDWFEESLKQLPTTVGDIITPIIIKDKNSIGISIILNGKQYKIEITRSN